MTHRYIFSIVLIVVLGMGVGNVFAGWPADAALNLIVADDVSEQVIPKVAATSDGGCFIAWFDHASGNYDVRLQRLDRDGNALWPHNGILVSDHSQDTWLCDWDMIADSADNAVLVFVDPRAGGDWDPYAYRISSDGDFLWGADGVTVAVNNEFDADPRVAELTDGSFAVAWSGEGFIGLQCISSAGVVQYGPTGNAIYEGAGESPGQARVVASNSGYYIVSWLRDMNFTGSHDLKAMMYSAAGYPAWFSPLTFYDAGGVPSWYKPLLIPDGAGGAIAAWHRSVGLLYSSFVQRISFGGGEYFAHNGVEVSTLAGFNHLNPSIAYNTSTNEIFVFWNEEPVDQNQWGVWGQKVSAAGARMWGNNGKSFVPMDTIYESYTRCVTVGDGAVVFYFDEPTGSVTLDRVLAFRVDTDGDFVWPGSTLIVSSILSSKSRLPIVVSPAGVSIAVWEDNRGGTVDLYAQNVNPNGTLGPLGDMNCDGNVNSYDIDGFICALSPQCDYESMYPACNRLLADCNGDGVPNSYDIDGFIALVGGG
ncbi:MAG: hypothetical protein ABIG44_00365 [Planctomycetota bacterium]